MPRKFLKRRLPSRKKIRKLLPKGLLGDRINNPSLWHLNRRSVSRAVGIGLFCAYLPMPMEMLPAALLAILCRANLPISVLLVWLSNPFTWILVYTPPYILGTALLGDMQVSFDSITVELMLQHLAALWLGCLIFGVALGAGGYFATLMVWRIRVIEHWESRRLRRKNKALNNNKPDDLSS